MRSPAGEPRSGRRGLLLFLRRPLALLLAAVHGLGLRLRPQQVRVQQLRPGDRGQVPAEGKSARRGRRGGGATRTERPASDGGDGDGGDSVPPPTWHGRPACRGAQPGAAAAGARVCPGASPLGRLGPSGARGRARRAAGKLVPLARRWSCRRPCPHRALSVRTGVPSACGRRWQHCREGTGVTGRRWRGSLRAALRGSASDENRTAASGLGNAFLRWGCVFLTSGRRERGRDLTVRTRRAALPLSALLVTRWRCDPSVISRNKLSSGMS